MSDYISREAAIEAVREEFGCETCNGSNIGTICTFCDVGQAILLIKNIPSADVEQVVHGRKIEDGDIGVFYLCSLCGECLPYGANYCPNCGAKMDLEGENDN